ncbi:hypothetical protein [Desertivirga arenae]|uniref:hypothetical protein n=1 Tax=Desertivirga arenae TaxID=2810309 RepID=UPI001A968682|nr:hypothetical protein [Pedobacter sp. SYSU D00823]
MLKQIYLITIFLSALIGLYHFKRSPFHLKGFALLLVLTAIVEIVGHFLKNNLWMFNLFGVIEFSSIFLLYRRLFFSHKIKNLLLLFAGVTALIYLSNWLFFQGLNTFNNYTFAFSCMLVTVTVLLFYHQLLNDNNPEPLLRVPMFWISTGILVFYPCNIFFMGLLNYIMHVSMDLAKQLYTIIHILNIIMYSLYSIGFICSATSRKSLS